MRDYIQPHLKATASEERAPFFRTRSKREGMKLGQPTNPRGDVGLVTVLCELGTCHGFEFTNRMPRDMYLLINNYGVGIETLDWIVMKFVDLLIGMRKRKPKLF